MDVNFTVLEGKTIYVTGATGLIGRALIKKILELNIRLACPIHVLAHVRDQKKAKRLFGKIESSELDYIESDICIPINYDGEIDYIVHGAGITSSKAFVEQPINTITTALKGTEIVLQLAKEKRVKGFIYLSSMEVYGISDTDEKITESHAAFLDTMTVRSSYPESKRMCESLCKAYYTEYEVPTMVLRLTQTFGAEVEYYDNRVFAEFARCVVEQRNIILYTKGETKRSYLYSEDAAEAILTVLVKGVPGQAYNVANEETYCSIFEMANLVAGLSTEREISVMIKEDDLATNRGYAPVLHMNLDTSKIQALGWKPKTGLKKMFEKLIDEFKGKYL